MSYNIDLVNKGAFANGGVVNVRESASTAGRVIYQTSDFAGILTGQYRWRSVEGTWYQLIALSTGYVYGYVLDREVVLKNVNPIQYDTAQGMINQMIENDKQTLTKLLTCAQYCKLLSAKGYNVSSYMSTIKKTYLSLYNRNQKLANSPGFTEKAYGKNALTEFAPALTSIVNNPYIGVISLAGVIVIVIVAVIAGGAVTAIFYGNQKDANQAEKDKKIATDLEGILEGFDKEIKNKIINYTLNEVHKSYKEGYAVGKKSGISWWDILKYGGVAAGTFFLIRYIKDTF